MSDYISDWLITDWLIGISNTDADGVTMYRFRGTRKDVKELLVKLAAQDREKDPDGYDHGTELVEHVQEDGPHKYQAYTVFADSHIDYTAQEFCDVRFLNDDGMVVG